jgi:NitT/TauT family transport system permease protein
LASWEAAYRLIQWRASVFPAPSTLIAPLLALLRPVEAFGGTPLIDGVMVSLLRLIVGFTISIICGAIAGLLMWRSKPLDDFFGPVFLGLQTLPSVCWVPLAVLLIGLNERTVLFVVVMGSVWAIALAFRDGLRSIPPIYRRVGEMLGTGGWRMYRYVLLPASVPALASTLRLGFSFAWRSLMGAEVIVVVARHGLGYVLQIGRQKADWLVIAMVVMVIIGIAMDRLVFSVLERRIYQRFGLELAH